MTHDITKLFPGKELPPAGAASWIPEGNQGERMLPSHLSAPGSSCLYSNNSIRSAENAPAPPPGDLTQAVVEFAIGEEINKLTPYHKRQAHVVYINARRLIEVISPSIENVCFLTLTFADNVRDHGEASRRFNSFTSNFFKGHPEYSDWMKVGERQTRGAWHYHILVIVRCSIRSGFDFALYSEWLDGNNRFRKPCPTGNPYLRSLWAEMKEALPRYNFGSIFSLEPIASTAEAVSRYVGKYISKHIGAREQEDLGVRLVSYSKGWLRNSGHFAWHSCGATQWRWKLAVFAKSLGCTEFYQLNELLGPGWAYKFAEDIEKIDISSPEKCSDCSGEFVVIPDYPPVCSFCGSIFTPQPPREYQSPYLRSLRITERKRNAAEIKDLIKSRKHQKYNREKEINRCKARNHIASLKDSAWLQEPPF